VIVGAAGRRSWEGVDGDLLDPPPHDQSDIANAVTETPTAIALQALLGIGADPIVGRGVLSRRVAGVLD
jgi:hypothetical protein